MNLELRMLRPALQHGTKSLRNNWDQCGCSRFSLPAQPQTSHSWEPDLGSLKAIYSQSSNTKSSQAGASRKGQWILELLHPQNPFSRESGLLCWALCSCPVNAAHLASTTGVPCYAKCQQFPVPTWGSFPPPQSSVRSSPCSCSSAPGVFLNRATKRDFSFFHFHCDYQLSYQL